ncbi:hypothetical protein AA0Y32_14960 [Georgenia phoenicis]|uniref:hypothetical protein n=1 Tax=unclassified Georgenia TaxID=2626815 RepID=UPI0039AE9CEA
MADALAVTDSGSGELCAVTDTEGLATIGWEELTNTSGDPVDVQDVDIPTPEIEVVEWAIFPLDWSGGVLSGDQLPEGEGSRQIEPGVTDQLVMVLRTDAATQSPVTAPTLTYRDGNGHQGSVDLTWSITLMPPGEECGDDW